MLRDGVGTELNPIAKVTLYEGPEIIYHSDFDKQWRLGGKDDSYLFSLTGDQAINATEALIIMVINTGISSVTGQKPITLKD